MVFFNLIIKENILFIYFEINENDCFFIYLDNKSNRVKVKIIIIILV